MSYTKGEWSFGHNIGVYSGETHIADIAPVNNGFDETLANAKVIAAAPDLLEALIALKDYCKYHQILLGSGIIHQIDVAIDKATY